MFVFLFGMVTDARVFPVEFIEKGSYCIMFLFPVSVIFVFFLSIRKIKLREIVAIKSSSIFARMFMGHRP